MTQHPELGLEPLYSVCDISDSHSNIAEGLSYLGCDAVSQDSTAFIFRGEQSKMVLSSFKISETTCPVIQHHILEGLNMLNMLCMKLLSVCRPRNLALPIAYYSYSHTLYLNQNKL